MRSSEALGPLDFSIIRSLKRQSGDFEPEKSKRGTHTAFEASSASSSSAFEASSASSSTVPPVIDQSSASPAMRIAYKAPQPPSVGNQVLHSSHTLEHKKGIIICQRCGYYTISKAGKLARLCAPITPGVKSGGRDFLSRWSKDLPPKKSVSWPNTFSYLPDGVIWRSQSYLLFLSARSLSRILVL